MCEFLCSASGSCAFEPASGPRPKAEASKPKDCEPSLSARLGEGLPLRGLGLGFGVWGLGFRVCGFRLSVSDPSGSRADTP